MTIFLAKIALLAATASLAIGEPAAATGASKVAGKTRVALLLDSLREDRYQLDRHAFERAVRAHGGEPLFASASGDAGRQADAIREMLAAGAGALVIQPVEAAALLPALAEAARRHVPVIAYDRFIDDANVALYVSHDHIQAGALQAEAALRSGLAGGRIVICMGQSGALVAEHITQGNEQALAQQPHGPISKRTHRGWSSADCAATVLRAIDDGGVGVVLANNSSMAVGAAEVVSVRGLAGKVFIAGVDASPESCRQLRSGVIQFEILKPIAPLAESAARAALALARGESVPTSITTRGVPTSLTPVFGVGPTGRIDQAPPTGAIDLGIPKACAP